MADQPYWNPSDKDTNVTLSVSNKRWSLGAGDVGAVRSTLGLNYGKWHIQAQKVSSAGSASRHGFATIAHNITVPPGDSAVSWVINGQGAPRTNSITGTDYDNFNNSERIDLWIDIGNGRIWYGRNGTPHSGSPSAGTGAMHTFTGGTTIYLCDGMDGGGSTRGAELYDIASYSGGTISGFTNGWGDSGGSPVDMEETIAGAGRMDGEGYAPELLIGRGVLLAVDNAARGDFFGNLASVLAAKYVELIVAGAGRYTYDDQEVTPEIGIMPALDDAGRYEGVGYEPELLIGEGVLLELGGDGRYEGVGHIPTMSIAIELVLAGAGRYEGGGHLAAVEIGVLLEVGAGRYEGVGHLTVAQAGRTVEEVLSGAGRYEGVGHVVVLSTGALLVVGNGRFEGQGYEPAIDIAVGVELEIPAGRLDGRGALPSVLAGLGVALVIDGEGRYEGQGHQPVLAIGAGATLILSAAAIGEYRGQEINYSSGADLTLAGQGRGRYRGWPVFFNPSPYNPEDAVTVVSGTFSAAGTSQVLGVRNQIESIHYEFADPGAATISLERAMPGGYSWEVVAGPFRQAASGSVITRANDRYRVRLRGYSQDVIYSIQDEDAIINELRDKENVARVTMKQSGLYVDGTMTATGIITGG